MLGSKTRIVHFARAVDILGPLRAFYSQRTPNINHGQPGQWLLDQRPASHKEIMEAANARLEQIHAESAN